MFSFWIGHNVCSAMLNPILSILLTNTQMAALALIIPIVAHRATNIGIDVKSRSNLQMFATLHGIVTGYTFKDYHLHLVCSNYQNKHSFLICFYFSLCHSLCPCSLPLPPASYQGPQKHPGSNFCQYHCLPVSLPIASLDGSLRA